MKRAFTLVELLVVVAIMAILVMFMLPAINSARESARRNGCMQQMSQLILGLHNYEMAHEVFPSGTKNPTGPIVNRSKDMHHSWSIATLPYLDEANLYKLVDHESSVYGAENKTAREQNIGFMLCPSFGGFSGAPSYAGVHHDVEAPIDSDNNGVLFLNSKVTRDDITDGLQYTLFLGEKLPDGAGEFGWMSGTRSTLRNTGTSINRKLAGVGRAFYEIDFGVKKLEDHISADDIEDEADQSASDESDPQGNDRQEGPKTLADDAAIDTGDEIAVDQVAVDSGEDEDFEEGERPRPKLSRNTAMLISSGLYVGGFGSAHVSGAVMAFGDGRVKFLADSTDMKTLKQLGNRRDGQVVDSEAIQ